MDEKIKKIEGMGVIMKIDDKNIEIKTIKFDDEKYPLTIGATSKKINLMNHPYNAIIGTNSEEESIEIIHNIKELFTKPNLIVNFDYQSFYEWFNKGKICKSISTNLNSKKSLYIDYEKSIDKKILKKTNRVLIIIKDSYENMRLSECEEITKTLIKFMNNNSEVYFIGQISDEIKKNEIKINTIYIDIIK